MSMESRLTAVFAAVVFFAVCSPEAGATMIEIGTNGGGWTQFDLENYDAWFYADTEPTNEFPKELNNSWWTTQYIVFRADSTAATAGLTITFDICDADLGGENTFGIEVAVRTNLGPWNIVGTAWVNRTAPVDLGIPASTLVAGTNTVRLLSVDAPPPNKWILWDCIRIGPPPEPFLPPTITAIVNHVESMWSNGVWAADLLVKSRYTVQWSPATHASGIMEYILVESRASDFSTTNQWWVFDGSTHSHELLRQPNGTYYYRVNAKAMTSEQTAWSESVAKTVAMNAPTPPSAPAITNWFRHHIRDVWINGTLVAHTNEGDFVLELAGSVSGEGVKFYEIQETADPTNFLYVDEHNYPDDWHGLPNPPVRLYLPPHPQHTIVQHAAGTFYYRARAVDVNGFEGPWNTAYQPGNPEVYTNVTITMAAPYPPAAPVMRAIERNVVKTVFSNGVPLVYTTQPNYILHMTIPDSGEGINVYEIQETRNPTNFLFLDTHDFPPEWLGDTNAPVQVYAPHFPSTNDFIPGTTMLHTNPVYQFFLKGNGTYYYRVRAEDRNGFKSEWNVAYDPENLGAYSNITIAMGEPYPPSTPSIRTNDISNLDGDIFVGFAAVTSGTPILLYHIQLSADPAFGAGTQYVLTSNPRWLFASLSPGTYYVRAMAEDWNGFTSDWSEGRRFTVSVPVVTALWVDQITNDSAVVRWTTDVPASSEVDRRGMYRIFDEWRDPDEFVQGVLYAPAEAYGAAITTNDVDYDLRQFKANNVNTINLYNLGWGELQKNGNVEEYIFRRAEELGLKVVVRLEAYNKYNESLPPVGDNHPTNHFAYLPHNADWIINYYTQKTPIFGPNGYATKYPGSILYLMINMPFDDPELRRQDGIGLNDWPDEEQQRDYTKVFYDKIKAIDPIHRVFINLGFGGQDRDPHFGVADLVDGISEHLYTVRLDYYTRCYGYIPGVEDADYLLMNQDVYDYYLEKMFAVNRIAENGKPVVIDQTGYCEINDFTTGLVRDKRAKARAIDLLRNYLRNHPHSAYGWTYFMAFDKFNEGGEQATWGLIDRLNQFADFFDAPSAEWEPVAGSWTVANGSLTNSGAGDELILARLGQKKGVIEATFNTGHGAHTNVFIVFAYENDANYRYAGYNGDAGEYLIAEVADGVTNVLNRKTAGEPGAPRLNPDTLYTMRAVVNFNEIRLDVDLSRKIVQYSFPAYTLGRCGLRTEETALAFDRFKMFGRVYDPEPVTTHSFKLNTLFPNTDYRIRALSGGSYSDYTNFTTAPEVPLPPRPRITVLTPAYGNAIVTDPFEIKWLAQNPAGDARIDLFYSRFERASCYNEENPSNRYEAVLIATNIAAQHNVEASYTWDPTGVPPGSYWILARIYRPGSGQPDEYDYSSGQLVLSSRTIPAVRVDAWPTVDGLLDEPEWADAPAVTYAVAAYGATQTTAQVKLMWDDVWLFIGFDVDDPEVAYGDAWNVSDGVFCFINNGRTSHNRIDVHTNMFLQDPHGGDHDRPIGSLAAITNRPGGYTAEMRIRWDSLRVIPRAGDMVPADFKLIDRTADGTVTHVSWDGNDDEWLAGRMIVLTDSDVGAERRDQFVIGYNNAEDLDFAQMGFSNTFLASRWDAKLFPKELNTSWWPRQDILLNLSSAAASEGLVVLLDAAHTDGEKAMDVAVSVADGGRVTTAGIARVWRATRDAVFIPPSLLVAGANTLRLETVPTADGPAWLTWDQIRIEPPAWIGATTIGANNNTDADLLGNGDRYDHSFLAGTLAATELPKELNLNWWSRQDILFAAGPSVSTQGLKVTLDPSWCDAPEGRLNISAGLRNVNGTFALTTMAVNVSSPGVVLLPPYAAAPGMNRLVLQAETGSGGATVITWDRIAFEALPEGERLDSDGDGLADGEEVFVHHTDPQRRDTDGDGVSDGAEIRAGTDPLDANSVLLLHGTGVQSELNRVIVSWPSVTAKVYTLKSTLSLSNTWTEVPGAIDLPGSGGSMSFTNTFSGSREYYRVQVE